MAIAILGPTFQDLAENVNKNVSQISYVFVGRSFGYFSGSLLGGILTDCMNVQLLLGKYTEVNHHTVFCIIVVGSPHVSLARWVITCTNTVIL